MSGLPECGAGRPMRMRIGVILTMTITTMVGPTTKVTGTMKTMAPTTIGDVNSGERSRAASRGLAARSGLLHVGNNATEHIFGRIVYRFPWQRPVFAEAESIPSGGLVLQFTSEADLNNTPLLIRPHLLIAAVCERHILEQDGALTLFRIVDRFTITGTTEELPATALQFMLAVSFRSGNFRGKLNLTLRTIDPSVKTIQELSIPALFEAPEERSTNLIGKVSLEVKEEGLYWIIVELAGEEYTRIPIRVVYQRQPTIVTGN